MLTNIKEATIVEMWQLMQACGSTIKIVELEKLLDDVDHKQGYLWTDAGELIGFYLLKRHWHDEYIIQFIGVSPLHRRKGKGTFLIDTFFDVIRMDRHVTVKVLLTASNIPTIFFFTRCGFVEERRENGVVTLVRCEWC